MRTTPDITINTYTIGQNLNYQRPTSTPVELNIDKGKYFGFTCDDVVQVQTDLRLFEDWTMDAGYQMGISIDQGILADSAFYSGAAAYNYGNTAGVKSVSYALGAVGAPLQFTKTNVLEAIVDAGSVLDEQNIPRSDRWMVLPAWAAGLIKKSDLKDVALTGDALVSGQVTPMRNGRIGSIDEFTIYISNNLYSLADTTLTSTTCYYAPFGHKSALTFASQLIKTETLRAESTFGDLVRGLNVYGYKVMKPVSLGMFYIRK